MSPAVLAHGTGPGHDLPVPLFYAIAGGALAVVASSLANGDAVAGQAPMMVLMVTLTIGGLTLLAAG